MLDCKQVLAELSTYLDDEVTLELARAIEKHLALCRRCWVVYDTSRKTRRPLRWRSARGCTPGCSSSSQEAARQDCPPTVPFVTQ